jgi:scyllo-inositol 2-dehydrogenase (NADP+)
MSQPIRVGLIGHGLAGGEIHAPLIEAAGDFRIVAVASSRDLSARKDQPRQAPSPEALIAAEDVDLVVVASPNETHRPLALAALAAGKHVLVDKPFALGVAEADEMIAAAKAADRLLVPFHNRRADGDFLAVKEVLASGELGEVLLFEARWDRFRPDAPQAWRNSDAAGAGILWDLGPHLIDQALQLFGGPESFTADIAAQRAGALADDYFELTLKYGHMRCILSSASVVAAPRPRFAVHGTKGSFIVHGIDPFESGLRSGKRPETSEFDASLPPIPATRVTPAGREMLELRPGSWVPFYRQVAAALRGQAPPPVRAEEAREVTGIIEQAFARSAS